MWPIHGFEKHLIFYRPLKDAVEIVRVLHASRDIRRIFEEEQLSGRSKAWCQY
jgi:plasmid stabilization system protein ParE